MNAPYLLVWFAFEQTKISNTACVGKSRLAMKLIRLGEESQDCRLGRGWKTIAKHLLKNHVFHNVPSIRFQQIFSF